jgi:RHS repeat-associated protein
MITNGVWVYAWDAENRLVSASNTVSGIAIANAYDHLNRRVRKMVGPVTRHYVWDGWNIAAEIAVDAAAGTTNVHFYTWGLDLSGTPQGAGGVGGLLADTACNNQPATCDTYFPCYDANGNVTEYVDGTGTVCGRYGYSPFGEIAAQSGDMADAFTHRFSTKPFDAETGLAVYQLRPYNPPLGRWITRDPIEEQDGLNLYVVVGNDLVNRWDVLGLVEGKYILRNVSNVELSIVQSALAYAPEQLDGFEIEYVPEKTCQCAKDNIRLVQALKIGWLGSPAIDTFPEVYKRHTNTPGGIPLPGYTQSGGRAGNHGALSYIDAPFDAMGDVFGGTDFNFETCALCSDETNLGCVTFSFNGKKRKIVPSSGSEVEAKRPTRLWRTAVKTWLKASGRKP